MRLGIQKNDTDSSPGTSLDGSFRKPASASSKFVPTSKRVSKLLKEYSTKLLDINIFAEYLQDWVTNSLYNETSGGPHNFSSPFSLEDLRTFDFALEGVLFQQLIRMPCPPNHPSDNNNNLKQDEFLALEDFLHTAAQGLWQTFWHKNKPMPYFLSYPRYMGSKFYTIEKAISRGRLNGLCGAGLMSKSKGNSHARWDDVIKFVLFKQNLDENALSPSVICEAIFYGVHILFSRSLSGYKTVETGYVFVSILDSKYGGVVKIGGDLGKLEVDLSDPYKSMAEWIMCHADVSVSSVERIWNGLGNVNWGDLGTLQILLAMYYSIEQWSGPARKSMSSLAEHHSVRLEKRRIETQIVEDENALVPYSSNYNGEIVEVVYEKNNREYSKGKGQRLTLTRGEILIVEDRKEGLKSFRVQEVVDDGGGSYIGADVDSREEVLTLFVGAHSSRLEPSWEDMNLWYQVQRQTKVLNILKEQGVSSKSIPEIISSGRIAHAGPCEKRSPNGVCDHPWCGTPVLATRPIGEPVLSVFAHDGPFSGDEATRLCRDCLAGLRSAKMVNILHGDIRPENVIRVGSDSDSVFVLVSWGRAVLEDRDSPMLNLRFSSGHVLEHGKMCPSSDLESLVYLVYYVIGGQMKEQDSIESALRWRRRCWEKRVIQRRLGQVSPVLKAFADYVDGVCGTAYAVDYDVWLRRLNRAVDGSDERGKMVCVPESSSGGGNSL